MFRYFNAFVSALNIYLFYINTESLIYFKGLHLAAAVLSGITALMPSE